MNVFELLRKRIEERFPGVQADWDDAPVAYGFLDIKMNGKKACVEWRPGQGFGISDLSIPDSHVFGEGPDQVHEDLESAFLAISNILSP